MKTNLSLRFRRFSSQIKEVFQHFIVFSLNHNWFAFPIDIVVKVIASDKVYAHSQGIGLTTYQNQEILVINLAELLEEIDLTSAFSSCQVPYLIIIQLEETIVGLSLNCSPKVYRVAESNLISLPSIYLSTRNLSYLRGQVIKIPDHDPILILEAQNLVSTSNAFI